VLYGSLDLTESFFVFNRPFIGFEFERGATVFAKSGIWLLILFTVARNFYSSAAVLVSG
jgi:hypothetical protein